MENLLRLRHKLLFQFSLILLMKSAVAWFVVFNDSPNWNMVLTEFPFFIIVFCLIEWFAAKRKLLYYMIANFLITIIYFAVLMYYKYYGVIATYHALQQAKKVTNVGESTYSLISPYYLFIFVDILYFVFVMFCPKYITRWKEKGLTRMSRKALIGMMVVSLGLCTFNIWPNHASMNEIKKAKSMGILNYEVYKIIVDTTGKEELIDSKEITQQAVDQLKGIDNLSAPEYWGTDKGKNLIIVQMESFQNFLIGLRVGGQEVTPNLNKLAKENTYFSSFYTNAGQGTTSDAEFVVNTSFYVPENEPATSSEYMNKALPSLPRLLGGNDYFTATFHTNNVDFWNRKDLYKAIDFDQYYDQSFYGDEDHIAFGSSDEMLFAKTIPELVKMDSRDQPFYAMIISMSAHHPFHIPEEKYKMELPKDYEGTLLGEYIRAQNYADYAMGEFLEELKTRGLWDDSLVVFYGDHQGVPMYSLTGEENDLIKSLIGHEYGYTDMFNIPFIVHSPGAKLPSVMEGTGSQIDIMPTLANLLGVSMQNQLHFGQDLFNQESNLIPLRHFLPTGSFVNEQSIYVTGNDYTDGNNYSLSDNTITTNGSNEAQFATGLHLLELSNSYLLQLPNDGEEK
ncbi:LTA synthase family protein [Paenibacillus sp. FSL R10-2796]|uniref:LTA synthase family protein n=2 Tax=Paenibacillus TaxID=44249 RepID=UPI00096BD69D|nr:LTA synthase family protein [Paenibacillus odorifer]OMD83604.1 sulfatase [Paenibacillus odorifer]